MTKEQIITRPENIIPEMKRRKRKVPDTINSITNISYKSLLELYIRNCRIKNLAQETINGYLHSNKYFLDFAGHDLMCDAINQNLINEYYLYLQTSHKASTVNSYVFKISPVIHYGVEKGYISIL